jgi:uncharacterized protein (TIGR03437 family)
VFFVLLGSMVCPGQVITTVAGGGFQYNVNGIPATQAAIQTPQGVTTDSAGNLYYFDTGGFAVRQVNSSGIVNTVAGGQLGYALVGQNIGDNGPATQAGFGPNGIFAGLAFDQAGNLYISDPGNSRVRKVDTKGIITTFAGGGAISGGDGGPANKAGLGQPTGLAVDSAGNVYIADFKFGGVRKVNTQGIISTFAGGGSGGDGVQATSAAVAGPYGLAFDNQGNLYIAQATRVRMVNSQGIISTVAGGTNPGFTGNGGPATSAEFFGITGIAVDNAGDLYIADNDNNQVRVVSGGVVNAVVGDGRQLTGGDGGLPMYAGIVPVGVAVSPSGNLYISSVVTNAVREVNFSKKALGITPSALSLYFENPVNHLKDQAQYVELQSVNGPQLDYTMSVTTQNGGNWLIAGSSGTTNPNNPGTAISVTNSPTVAGTYKGTVTVTPALSGYPPVNIQVTYVIAPSGPATPVISDVQNGASFQSGYMGGAIWTIKGTGLASITGSDTWNNSIVNGALPTSLDGVTVTFEGVPAYISYLSSTQINLVTPTGSTANAGSIVVSNNGAASQPFEASSQGIFSPAFFTWPQSQVVATRTDYTYAVAANTFSGLTTAAAKPGDVLILWGTGFGPPTPAVADGDVVPGDQEYYCGTTPSVTINSVAATVYGCALAGGYAGLYQVAIQVPPTLTAGTYPIVATSGEFDPTSSPSTVVLVVQ